MALIGIWCKLCGQKSVLDYNDVEDGSVTKCDHDCGAEFHWKNDAKSALYPEGGNLTDAGEKKPGGEA